MASCFWVNEIDSWVTTDPALVPGGRDLEGGDYFAIDGVDGIFQKVLSAPVSVMGLEPISLAVSYSDVGRFPEGKVVVPARRYDTVQGKVY